MSQDYTKGQVVSLPWPTAAIANATTVMGVIGSPSYDYGIISATLSLTKVPTLATATVKLQKSDSSGDFSSAVDLAQWTVTSGGAIGDISQTLISAANFPLPAGTKLRSVYIANNTDATSIGRVDVVLTPRDC